MTRQQELELLAEWLGIEGDFIGGDIVWRDGHEVCFWNPLNNDTDFLNMVAGRVGFEWYPELGKVAAIIDNNFEGLRSIENYADHNNSEYLAMKHAAYQVCLMAAGEGKE